MNEFPTLLCQELEATVRIVEQNATKDLICINVRPVTVPRNAVSRRIQQATHVQALFTAWGGRAEFAHRLSNQFTNLREAVQWQGLPDRVCRICAFIRPTQLQGRPMSSLASILREIWHYLLPHSFDQWLIHLINPQSFRHLQCHRKHVGFLPSFQPICGVPSLKL